MKAFRLIFAIALYVVLCIFTPALADVIQDYDTAIIINKDSSVDITDSIMIDFGTTKRHGIFRTIPVMYDRYGVSYSLPLKVISVTTDSGRPEPYQFSHQGNDLMIKVGDAGHTVSGAHMYRIKFKVDRAVNFFDKTPEFYWNVTGDQWPYPINHAHATVEVPAGIDQKDIRATSYYGPPGSKTNAFSSVQGPIVRFSTVQPLQPGEGLTIVIGMPAGSVIPPPWWKEYLQYMLDSWPAWVVPCATLAVMSLLWWNSGRDVDGNHPIAVEWTPPKDLSPAEVGTLVDESCDMEDIVSTLIDLAVRGHLIISQTTSKTLFFFSNKDYVFTKTEPPATEKLSPHEEEFLRGIFNYNVQTNATNNLSDLKAQFYTHLPTIKKNIYDSLASKGLFLKNPDSVRSDYQGLAIVFFLIGIWTIVHHTAWGFGIMCSGVIVYMFAKAMPARTAAGSQATRECLGFARFVRMAEKDRIRVLAKDDPTIFGRLLPYAMVLGAADQWAEAFEGLMTAPPDWYRVSDYGDNYRFSASDFVNDLGNGMNTMRSTFASVPVSSGSSGYGSAASGDSGFSGGFSGGGFGGGGGGSW
ncbi:MAG: DUF2207 domain-containing protein [Cyanobacteria bacterium SZAS-4]|nr:DUF2207 domain-containing protein [Cyanobacteria bacterium SZAS-4]